MYRTATTADSVYTRFGAIPLGETPDQWLSSPRHSRFMAEANWQGAGRWSGYYEADFLDPACRSAYRMRQFWGAFERGSWQILAGQGWSLLRPNRAGISSRGDLMNTIAVEPAYHVGLAGGRNRQLRVMRRFGAWAMAVAYEHGRGGDITAKLVHDSPRLHWEAVLLGGRRDRYAAGTSLVFRLNRNLSWVGQQIWSQGCGPDLVGGLPRGVHAHGVIEGIEARLTPSLEVFAYGGLAYATRSSGNRLLRQWSAGLHRRIYHHPRWGSSTLSVQYSQLDRSVWPGGHGEMNYLMLGVRHFLPAQR